MFSKFAIPDLPGGYYFSNIFGAEDKTLFQEFISLSTKQRSSKRILGISGAKGPNVTVFQPQIQKVPNCLTTVLSRLLDLKILPQLPTQVSVNHYESDEKGMVPHKDGSGYQAIIVTLGCSAVLEFFHYPEPFRILRTSIFSNDELDGKFATGIFLEPGSVFLMTEKSFTDYVHRIKPQFEDTITHQLGNFYLLNKDKREDQTYRRGERISIVMWNEHEDDEDDDNEKEKKSKKEDNKSNVDAYGSSLVSEVVEHLDDIESDSDKD